MNADCIVVDKPIAGLTGLSFNKCTTLDQVLAALAACCENAGSAVATIPASAFADPANPTDAETAVWVAANGPFGPNTLLRYIGNGTAANPDYVWHFDGASATTRIEEPSVTPTQVEVLASASTTRTGIAPNVFTTVAFDVVSGTHPSSVAAGVFTAPVAGLYLYNTVIWSALQSWPTIDAANSYSLAEFVNGVFTHFLDAEYYRDTANSGYRTLTGNGAVRLNAGDRLEMRVVTSNVNTASWLGSAPHTYIKITKVSD